MLDFAIFAVTFLLALVGAVLYLYPVTSDSGLVGVRLRRADLGLWGALAGGSRGSGVRAPCACVLGDPVGPTRGLVVLGGLLRSCRPQTRVPLAMASGEKLLLPFPSVPLHLPLHPCWNGRGHLWDARSGREP
ncbi:hypothetical protein STEG23_018387 [Scotinomys teguina]